MLGYTAEQIDKMMTTLNYTIHHHMTGKFADEDRAVLRDLEDFLEGLIAEGRVS
jgi:putative N-acetylmannosamine-6-phosphate epimerase